MPGGAGRDLRGWSHLTEGDPATCFYVLLEGAVVMSRRVGSDDIEVNRTADRGVYAGAFQAYLGERAAKTYNNSLRATVPSRFFVLDANCFAEMMTHLVPHGRAPAGGGVLRQQGR